MKKVLSLVLAVVLVLGMSTVAFAADAYPYDVEDVEKSSAKLLDLFLVNGDGDNAANYDSSVESYKIEGDVKVNPDIDNSNPYAYNLNATAMSGTNNTLATTTDYYLGVYIKDTRAGNTYSPLLWTDKSKYDVGVKLNASSPIFKGVSLQKGKVSNDNTEYTVVRFELYNYLDSTSAKSFADKIYLTVDGKKMSGTEFEIKGKFDNNKYGGADLKDEEETEIDLTSPANRKIAVKVNIRNVEVELDYDVFLYTTLYNGRNVYARANNVADNTQFAVMEKYASVDEVITLYTAGLTSTTKVFFDRPEKFYVYGVDSSASYDAVADSVKLVYLGTTDQKLPLVDQYFLSTKELAIETTPVEPEPSVPAESSASNPVGGGDTTAPNANYNPGTGC